MRAGVQPAPNSGGKPPGFGLDDSRHRNVILTIVDSKNKNKKIDGAGSQERLHSVFKNFYLLSFISMYSKLRGKKRGGGRHKSGKP